MMLRHKYVASHISVRYNTHPPPPPRPSSAPFKVFPPRFWAWPCITSNFDKGRGGDHRHKITDQPFKTKWDTRSLKTVFVAVARLDNKCWYNNKNFDDKCVRNKTYERTAEMKSNEGWSFLQLWTQFMQLRKKLKKKIHDFQQNLNPWPHDTGITRS